MTRSNIEKRLDLAVKRASRLQSGSAKKRISPHTIRHATAMTLLKSGVAFNVIALWLGHESIDTTQMYLDANLVLKEQALAKTAPANAPSPGRYRPDDRLLAFLKGL